MPSGCARESSVAVYLPFCTASRFTLPAPVLQEEVSSAYAPVVSAVGELIAAGSLTGSGCPAAHQPDGPAAGPPRLSNYLFIYVHKTRVQQ